MTFREQLEALVASGKISEAEAYETEAFFESLAERELAGELTPDQAIDEVVEFGVGQLRRRAS